MTVATLDAQPAAAVPSHDEIVARARRVAIAIKENAAQADDLRRVPDESVRLMKEQGLLQVIQPRRAGGWEMSMRAHMDVIAALAEGCGSAAWVAGVAHAHSWLLGHFPEQALQEVYGKTPVTLVSAVIGPRGKAVRHADGSHTLQGFWPFGSGCQHAQWLILGAEVVDDSGASGEVIDAGDFLVPAADVEIRDDWYVAGLQGTGSNSLTCKGLKVPAHRYLSLEKLFALETPGLEDYDGWLYRAEAVPVLALCITGSALGIARSALPEYLRIVPGKALAYTGYTAEAFVGTQISVAAAATLIDCADFLLYRIADDIDRYARAGDRMSMEMRGRIRMDCAQAVRFCMEGMDKLFHTAGASGLSMKGSLQRAWRNLHAINMHGLLAYDTSAELYGRVLLGLEPNTEII